MTSCPKVSVIIPVYNRENLIQRSINSVLNQTYNNIEVIVIDDASTDNTWEKIKELDDDRIKYYKNDLNKGPSNSRNRGIALSTGELIAFQDSDDEWLPQKLDKQVGKILKSPNEVAAVYCRMTFYDYKSGRKKNENFEVYDFKKYYRNGPSVQTPAMVTVLIKKTVLDELGYFDERIKIGEDTELAMRISKKYSYTFVDEPLVLVTKNHEQLTNNTEEFIHGREIIYEKHNDFLSRVMLFNICREVSTYYILKKEIGKARYYIVKSFKHKFDFKTLILLAGIITVPFIIKYVYQKKYKGQIPVYLNNNTFD